MLLICKKKNGLTVEHAVGDGPTRSNWLIINGSIWFTLLAGLLYKTEKEKVTREKWQHVAQHLEL